MHTKVKWCLWLTFKWYSKIYVLCVYIYAHIHSTDNIALGLGKLKRVEMRLPEITTMIVSQRSADEGWCFQTQIPSSRGKASNPRLTSLVEPTLGWFLLPAGPICLLSTLCSLPLELQLTHRAIFCLFVSLTSPGTSWGRAPCLSFCCCPSGT